ncbi:MAG: LysR family transcriptional regulator [Thiothrix sp.]|nr:LysR family transcriptional regulator [Thiothrix sp.]HPQ95535.1 LysR family transcriptional regulator [Thiolinea sp.]
MNLQRKHLELIQAIHEQDSLAEAARQLHLTPSALSHQLNELEHRIGMEVIRRKSRPLKLTAAGQRLLDSAGDTLPRFSRLEQDLARMHKGDGGRINIAIECHSCYQWLLPTLDQYRRQWPDVELDIAGGFSFTSLNALAEGELDLVITADPEPLNGISYIPLFRYEAVLVLPLDHPLTRAETITPALLADQTLIIYPVPQRKLDIFRLFLRPADVEPVRLRQCELTVMMVALVASGRGLCTLPNWAASEYTGRQYVTARSLGPDGIFNTLHAAVREEHLGARYLQDFLFLAKDLPFSTLEGIARPA